MTITGVMYLIVKERTKPIKVDFCEAILCRIPANHPQIPLILSDLGKREAGYIGEKKLDFFLSHLPEKEYFLFHDLRLPNGNSFFQIDTLLLTHTFALVIETKYMTGELEFDEKNNQLIQRTEEKQKGYDDPLLQAQFQVRRLREFFKQHKLPSLPIEYLIMMSHANAVLKTEHGSEARKRVCRSSRVVFKVEEFSHKYRLPALDQQMIKKISKLLLKKHTEDSFDIEELYRIPRSGLLKGVHCPECRYLGLVYYQGSWRCPKCKGKSRDAHLKALRDYYLLFGPSITNQQFREFLHIDCSNTASKLLKKLNLPHSGANKNRIYQLKF
jgi:hypothetical protein